MIVEFEYLFISYIIPSFYDINSIALISLTNEKGKRGEKIQNDYLAGDSESVVAIYSILIFHINLIFLEKNKIF